MGKNPSFRCSDEFHENIELATDALDFDNNSKFIRACIRTCIVSEASTIIDYHDDVESLTWEGEGE